MGNIGINMKANKTSPHLILARMEAAIIILSLAWYLEMLIQDEYHKTEKHQAFHKICCRLIQGKPSDSAFVQDFAFGSL